MELEKQIGFLENQVEKLSNRTKSLEYDLAEMTVENNQLRQRVKKLATRPAGKPHLRPIHQTQSNKYNHNHK
jgi:prefoldin subunit 5